MWKYREILKYKNVDNAYQYFQTTDPSAIPDFTEADLKGCEYIQFTKSYHADQEEDCNDKPETYYPSGKIYLRQGCYNSHMSRKLYFYPNGRVARIVIYDTTSTFELLIDLSWHFPKGTTEDSALMYAHKYIEKDKAANRQQQVEKRRQDSVRHAVAMKSAADKRRDDSLAEVENIHQAALNRLSDSIDSKYKAYKGIYVGSKQSIFLVDPATHQPIVKTTYPHGEHLFQKSDTLYKSMYNDYTSSSGYDAKMKKGNEIITLLDKLITIANGDTKDMDKQMKKAETMDDIRKVLGL